MPAGSSFTTSPNLIDITPGKLMYEQDPNNAKRAFYQYDGSQQNVNYPSVPETGEGGGPMPFPNGVYDGVIVRTPWLRSSDQSDRFPGLEGEFVSGVPQPTEMGKITDGASNTMVVAEKYVRADLYQLGSSSDDTCEYYERGLLAPGVDYDAPPAYLNTPLDVLDPDGYVSLPSRPGLGYDINWEYIEANRA